MRTKSLLHIGAFLLAAFAALLVSSPLLANQSNGTVEEIVIQAPIQIEKTTIDNPAAGLARTEVAKLTRPVSYEDLDLARSEDVRILEQRIEFLAKDSCQRLSDMFPLDRSTPIELRRCMDEAIASALQQKEYAIASAN
jgi:UrcA family protein